MCVQGVTVMSSLDKVLAMLQIADQTTSRRRKLLSIQRHECVASHAAIAFAEQLAFRVSVPPAE